MYNLDKIVFLAADINEFEKTCSITVALKIVDNTCKMSEKEKELFMMLYDVLIKNETEFFDNSIFDIIQNTRDNPSKENIDYIKVFREDAMAYITKPKMKAFKAMIREKLSF